MSENRDDNRLLPSFEAPPVEETLLSITFAPLRRLTSGYVGRLWAEKYLDRFPITEDHQPLPYVVEEIPLRKRVSVRVEMTEVGRPPLFRTWFVDKSDSELIQIQQDRFIRNWRRRHDRPYPRFPGLRDAFLADFQSFVEFVDEHGLGTVTPVQCEVTYVNHISTDHASPERVFAFWSGRFETDFQPQIEQLRSQTTYTIPGDDDNPIGRLYATLQPVFRASDHTPVYYYELTARSVRFDSGMGDMHRFLDVAHEWIVRSFESTTRPQMWEIWRRQNG